MNQLVFDVKSPTRVDLAGGTLDFWPLFLFLDDPVTVNLAIDIFTQATLRPGFTAETSLESLDQGVKKKYADLEACLSDREPAFELTRAILAYFKPDKGFELTTNSMSPLGAGLGGSSSLCISQLKAFARWMGESFETHEMVRLASNLEAKVLRKPTGTQDYFPAISGGLNFIHYLAQGPRQENLAVPDFLQADRFCLVYTGRSHNSGINNWQVIKDWLDGDKNTQQAFVDLSNISKKVEAAVRTGKDWELNELFRAEFEARVRLCSEFSSPEIEELNRIARKHDAAAKICGAGGGGCVLIWCPNGQLDRVRQDCNAFQILEARPWEA